MAHPIAAGPTKEPDVPSRRLTAPDSSTPGFLVDFGFSGAWDGPGLDFVR